MIKQLEESGGSILGFRVSGRITLEEEREWIKKIEKVLEDHDRVSVLAILEKDAGWGIKAGLEDLKWISTHMRRLHKIAIVTDSTVWKWLVNMDSPFAKMVKIDEAYFPMEKLAEAWAWVGE